MPKKKDSKITKTKDIKKKKDEEEDGVNSENTGEEGSSGEELDPSIIEDSFDEFSEYNDVDNF